MLLWGAEEASVGILLYMLLWDWYMDLVGVRAGSRL